jgi:biopolymer transport protein ExbB
MFHLFFSTFQKGGYLMWCILFTSLVIWYIGVGKLFYLKKFSRTRERLGDYLDRAIQGGPNDGFNTGTSQADRLINDIAGSKDLNVERGHDLFREFLIAMVPELNRGITTMAAWIAAAPLLGLLGTVVGMIQTFKVITLFGIGNPTLTAEGISVALLTTQAGLTVAFPGMLFQNYLSNTTNTLVSGLLKDGEELISRIQVKNLARRHV